MKITTRLSTFVLVCCLLAPCGVGRASGFGEGEMFDEGNAPAQQAVRTGADVHSYANTSDVVVKHVDLDWDVLFEQKILRGTAVLHVERVSQNRRAPLILDTRNLNVTRAEVSTDGVRYRETTFNVGTSDTILGAPLTVELPANATRVRISYATNPGASGLQWLEPSQTAGKRSPFMFTQSQAIHARSWIPLQDSPGVRVTYTARVRTPRNLLAVMSAENDPRAARDGDYSFRMTQPIPSYLIALAVGDLRFRALGRRTGVYAEPSVLAKAAWEFADTEKMVVATERLYGPYRWGRYDLLVLPPSFPFGGMENPRLTFATPTVLAGDRSLVALVAHELAHSWSGNLVTNATWRDFWLNEGFTTYLERRIVEAVYGRPRADMEAVLGRRTVEEEMATLEDKDEILHVDLRGRDPDEGFTTVPYEKGALFLRHLEETFGRPRFDAFLRGYFQRFAFQSITTEDFEDYLRKNLLDKYPRLATRVPVEEWIERAGFPASAPRPASPAFARVERQAQSFTRGDIAAARIQTAGWTTHEWLHFLKSLPDELDARKMQELDNAFRLTRSGNNEVAFQWLLMAIRNRYEAAYPRLDEYLTSIGRRKLIKPLYEELVKTPEGRQRALDIYRRARPGYHPIAVTTIDDILKWKT
ncbi:MAG TPA: M1 family metallopeptidase [Pyrinomonadaceae bacterium]|jgi:leukotriene A-4 hydrolase/aminopeptidase|nr:M1 family metallopeptidase [Pyrinomonadaceae bacterium]